MPKIVEMKLSSCGFEVADIRKNCDCGIVVVEQHFFKKLRNYDCGSASFKLRNCDCGLQKKLHVPTSGNNVVEDSNSQPDGGFSSEKRLLPDRVAANVKVQANLFLQRS